MAWLLAVCVRPWAVLAVAVHCGSLVVFFEPATIGSIRRKGVHLGYVPRARNATIAQLLRFGHNNVFECRVMKVDKSADPRNQVHVGIYVVDKRKKN